MVLVLDDTISGMTETLSGKALEDILTTADDVAQLVSGLITVSLIFSGVSVPEAFLVDYARAASVLF